MLVYTTYVHVPGHLEAENAPDKQQLIGPECFPEMLNYLDKNLGRLMKTVQDLGISYNTIFIFCADNGAHKPVTYIFGEDKIEISGGKMTITDRDSRAPLIVRWPNKVKPSSRNNNLIKSSDIIKFE